MMFKITAVILLLLNVVYSMIPANGVDGLTIVVTFPYMLKDVENIICDGDKVISIVVSGVDPHEYQLTLSDIELISKADVVISTAHTHFELKIKELTLAGELRVKLIEIPYIQGLVLLQHPSTGITNLHGVLLYGHNYIEFIKNLSSTLAKLRPSCSEIYLEKANEVMYKVEELSVEKPLKGLKAIVDNPIIQYLALWLGADVVHVMMLEHDVPITFQDVLKTEEIIKRFKDEIVVVVTEDSAAYKILEDLAARYGVRMVIVPNPIIYPDSILEYFKYTHGVAQGSTITPHRTVQHDVITFIVLAMVLVLIMVLAIVIWSRR